MLRADPLDRSRKLARHITQVQSTEKSFFIVRDWKQAAQTDRAQSSTETNSCFFDDPENRLEVLPPSLSQLTQLEVLTLSSNHVYQLPDEMVGLEKLKVCQPHVLCRHLW